MINGYTYVLGKYCVLYIWVLGIIRDFGSANRVKTVELYLIH